MRVVVEQVEQSQRKQQRASAEGYCIQIVIVNGDVNTGLSQKSFYIENISKGGFRFHAENEFELEDRVQVILRFPDQHTQEVLGRICYAEDIGDGKTAYGFSIIRGFYTLP